MSPSGRITPKLEYQHIAIHGPWCPGYDRPPHRVDPDWLQLDHRTGLVLCNLCNVHAGPAPGRGPEISSA